ncbi:hypothetical protein PTKIN_Ptkin09bG0040600 [Pterospermum kingtungense]
MSGFGLNLRNANANTRDQLNKAREQPPSTPTPKGLIACRICDCVFTNDKALFDHMEAHLLLNEAATRRKLLQSHMSNPNGSLLAPRFNSNIAPLTSTGGPQVLQQPRSSSTLDINSHASSSSQPRETNPFLAGSSTINPDPQSSSAAPSRIASASRDNNKPIPKLRSILPAVAPKVIFVPQPRIDCFTRPFLNQLETNLLMEGMASFADREIAGKVGDQPDVDLTLKL